MLSKHPVTTSKGDQLVPPSPTNVVIRFAGDSGDGIQLSGDRLAKNAVLGNTNVMTIADFPAEIRAPAGTTYGVSGYQIKLGDDDAHTAGGLCDVLVVFNPAALKVNLERLKPGGLLVAASESFNDKFLTKAGYATNPLESGGLEKFRCIQVPLTTLNRKALEHSSLERRMRDRCKNFFALGIVFWLVERPLKPTLEWIKQKFITKPSFAEANSDALAAGYKYAAADELFRHHRMPLPQVVERPEGVYRYVNGNDAFCLGLLSAAESIDRPLMFSGYPITPASSMLHFFSRLRYKGVVTFQAEDEIAAIGAAVGASYAGSLAITATSGPGLCLKGEFLGLAVITELPLVVMNVQRGGPSTGLPTKAEQSDLNLALAGRNGESPAVVLAPSSPADCFATAREAVALSIRAMTPVIVLSDGYLANSSETWQVPQQSQLAPIEVVPLPELQGQEFRPYERDAQSLARPWAAAGTPGYRHTIGGLEKEDGTGKVSYDGDNHQHMVQVRAAKIAALGQVIPPCGVHGEPGCETLLIGWGSSFGALREAQVEQTRRSEPVAHLHLRHINPLPPNLGEVLSSYRRLVVAENNSGQLLNWLRQHFPQLVFEGIHKITGSPFTCQDIVESLAGPGTATLS